MASLIDRREVEKLLVIHAALRSGLVDALAVPGQHSPEEVAARLGADVRACRVMLFALADIGLAEVTEAGPSNELFWLNETGRAHLVEPGPEFERNSLLHQITKLKGWLELPYVIEHGHPPPREEGRDIRTFSRTMAEGVPAIMDGVVESILAYAGKPRGGRMVDLGGALGHIALRFVRRGMGAVLCDRAEVLQEAEGFLREERVPVAWAAAEPAAEGQERGAGERAVRGQAGVKLLPCDFTKGLPPGPFHVAYLGNVYHIYGPDTNREVSRRVFAALAPGGVIAVRDFVWERSPRAVMFAVNMLQATEEGGVWREAEYREWLEAAGFVDVSIEDVEAAGNQLILGRRPGG